MGTLRKLDQSGDTKHEWDPNKPVEIEMAREVFRVYCSQGFAAARMEPDGTTGEIIKDFEPDAATIVFVPPLKGG